MIPLVRSRLPAAFPSDFLGDKLRTKHVDLIDRYFKSLASGEPMAFDSSKWKSAKTKLRADSWMKCAYCEASTSVVAHGDVEHFRPKSLYWWLAYDFDNYLFACQVCNQIYKKDFFPVTPIDHRMVAPVMPAAKPVAQAAIALLASSLAVDGSVSTNDAVRLRLSGEDADLVNPYFEDPAAIFSYEADDSNEEVWVRPGTHPKSNRAYAASEEYLGINRETLRRDRYGHYSVLAILKLSIGDPGVSDSTRKAIRRQFAKMSGRKAPFAGMHRYFLMQWGLAPAAWD